MTDQDDDASDHGLVRGSDDSAVAVSALDLGPAGLALSGVLVALSYMAIALLLRPGTSALLRLVGALVVAAMILGPGFVENELATRREAAGAISLGGLSP